MNYNQFCTAQIWRCLAIDFIKTQTAAPQKRLAFEICTLSCSSTIHYRKKTCELLIEIFKGHLTVDDFAGIFSIMLNSEGAIGSELQFYLVPFKASEGANANVSAFVKSLYEVSFEGQLYRFVPSYTFIDAIFKWKNIHKFKAAESLPSITFTSVNPELPLENEFFKGQSAVDALLTIPVDADELEQRASHLETPHTPLQYLYYQLEKLLTRNI
jgi:hypothetical protein